MGDPMGNTSLEPLIYDASDAIIDKTGLSTEDLPWLAPRLEAARGELLQDLDLWHAGRPIPKPKIPLDVGFMDLPDRLLDEYRQKGPSSELGQILQTAERLRESFDRVVLLGIGGSYMGARALFEACCHPYHNELSRDKRLGRPRIYFEGDNVDNDTVSGLLDLLGTKPARSVEDRWAMIVISKSGKTLETAIAFQALLSALRDECNDDPNAMSDSIVPITGTKGRLRDLSNRLGCRETFPVPEGVGGRYSILSAVGLLPAAVMGLDIVRLLEGASAMNERFRSAAAGKAGQNPVLDFVGVCRIMEIHRGANIRVLATWGKRLEAVGLWYDQLLAESLGKNGQGATPLTVVNTRDLHSRGQQHQDGHRDKLITNLIVNRPQYDTFQIEPSGLIDDEIDELAAGKTLPEILEAAMEGTNEAYADDGRPTAEIRLPSLDEASIGQLLQMLMLATAVEGRLVGINPFGQPGVEAYKKKMNALLGID